MKKTLKLVGIFIAILTVGITGGLSVYFLIQNNKTYYIDDIRIIEPIAEANTYIYTNAENTYATLKNQKVYMTAESDNLLEIAVFLDTTASLSKLKIQSSDRSVADIVYLNGKCYVEYKKAGQAEISVSIDMVKDSFMLYVYNRPADEFNVYDLTYYGKYAEKFANKIVAYADDKLYEYDFSSKSAFYEESDEEVEEPAAPVAQPQAENNEELPEGELPEEEKKPIIDFKDDDETVNGDLLEIDRTSVNEDVFAYVELDASTRKLSIQCKSSLSEILNSEGKLHLDESIVIQSYYYSAEGEKKPSKSYVVDVHIIPDAPEFLQVEMAATPDFENSYILMDTKDFAGATEEEIAANIESFLSFQKAEQYLLNQEEKSSYTAFFTDKVSEIYLKFRKVYTNGDIVYLDELSKEENPFSLSFEDDRLILSQNKEYYTLKLDREYFETNGSNFYEISLQLGDFLSKNSTFKFEFKEFNEDNLFDFYEFDVETLSFRYKYWDLRTRYSNEFCDPDGNIVDFGGLSIDFEELIPDDVIETGVKFVSESYDQESGMAIFEVSYNVPFELTYECLPDDAVIEVVGFEPVDYGTAANRYRFTVNANGIFTATNSSLEPVIVEIKVKINGTEYTDRCIVKLKTK